MSSNQYSPLVVVHESDASRPAELLQRLPLASAGNPRLDEAWLQDLILEHPSILPISEIDPGFGPLTPICRELGTRAGSIDAVFANPHGMLTLVESKLWRNPQARREVVGQILDYAKELSHWDYADLQREVSRSLKIPGNVLYESVKKNHPDLDEARFADDVSRGLRNGRFLLLVVGDGIRESVEAIAEFIQKHAGLHFIFGIAELGLYRLDHERLVVQPRVLARTAILTRNIVDLKSNEITLIEETAEDDGEELSDDAKYYQGFWSELLANLPLDDVEQMPPNPTRSTNIFLGLGGQGWISAYFSKRKNVIGVYLTFQKGGFGNAAYERLLAGKDSVDREIGLPLVWESDGTKHRISIKRSIPDPVNPLNRGEELRWFADVINRFVNVFRKRVMPLYDELR